MLIKIDTADVHMKIPVPSSIVFSGPAASVISNIIKKYAGAGAADILTKEQLHILFRGLRECRRYYPRLDLVDVQTAGGEHIVITL